MNITVILIGLLTIAIAIDKTVLQNIIPYISWIGAFAMVMDIADFINNLFKKDK